MIVIHKAKNWPELIIQYMITTRYKPICLRPKRD